MDIERPDLLKKRQLRKKILTVALSAIAVAAAVYVFTLGKPNPSVKRSQVWIGEVKQGDMHRNVRGLGKLVPQDTRWITARASGRVEEKLVLSGAEVTEGTVILKLSNPQLEQEYLNAQLELKAAEAELTSTQVRLQSELLALRSAYVQLKEQTEMALLDEEINNQLFEDGLVSELNLKRSALSAKHLTSRLEMEEERLEFQSQSLEPQMATQQTQVDRAKARLALVESKINALEVRAGSDGVLQRLDLEEGMQISEGQELALVSDLKQLKGVIEIQESQAREIQIGQHAEVDTRTSGLVNAVVSRIDPNVERGIVKVDVVFEGGLPSGCRADQSVQGTIELQRLTNVTYVERPTVVYENSVSSIFRLDSGGKTASRTSVEFGKTSVAFVEISSGLNAGEQIILSDTSRWEKAEQLDLR